MKNHKEFAIAFFCGLALFLIFPYFFDVNPKTHRLNNFIWAGLIFGVPLVIATVWLLWYAHFSLVATYGDGLAELIAKNPRAYLRRWAVVIAIFGFTAVFCFWIGFK